MKILVTGFEAFGEDEKNVSQEVLKLLKGPEGTELQKLMVPVVFKRASEIAVKAINEFRPHAVVMLGQAGGRDGITPERAAINVMDAEKPDNAGYIPKDEPIAPDGAAAYFSTLPIKKMTEAMKASGVNACVSNTAGTYVCNSLMYGVLKYLAESKANSCVEGKPQDNEPKSSVFQDTIAGFIHLPYFKKQVAGKPEGTPYMELEDIVRGIEICLETLI